MNSPIFWGSYHLLGDILVPIISVACLLSTHSCKGWECLLICTQDHCTSLCCRACQPPRPPWSNRSMTDLDFPPSGHSILPHKRQFLWNSPLTFFTSPQLLLLVLIFIVPPLNPILPHSHLQWPLILLQFLCHVFCNSSLRDCPKIGGFPSTNLSLRATFHFLNKNYMDRDKPFSPFQYYNLRKVSASFLSPDAIVSWEHGGPLSVFPCRYPKTREPLIVFNALRLSPLPKTQVMLD